MELFKRVADATTSRRRWRGVGAHLRLRFAAGLLLLVPVILTYLILKLVFDFLNELLGVPDVRVFDRAIPGAGILALLLLLYFTGLVGSTFIGRRPIALLQRLLFRIPLVSVIYSASKQLVESFSGKPATGFKRVVVIEYPRPGVWSLGFLTGLTTDEEQRRLAVVYIPTAPLPNSGWVAVLPVEDVYDTDLRVQDAMRMVLSGGILFPRHIAKKPMQEPVEALPS